jgi:hypothetical protein
VVFYQTGAGDLQIGSTKSSVELITNLELRDLRQENSKLKQMVANFMLEKEAIAEALKKL